MGFPDRLRGGRTLLAVELLEDRTTPTKLDDALTLALPELVASGVVAGDRVNVVMTAETTNAADAAQLAAAPFAAEVKALGFGIYRITLAPGTDLAAAVSYYGSSAGVISAAPDAVVRADKTPNDPSYSSLYGLSKISAPTAWDTTTGNGNFVVAVIDSGVDYTHPDLAANMWKNPNEIAGNGIDDDADGIIDDVYGADFANGDGNPMDDNNHGTHVAGTIGAVGNNAVGVAGVNWSVKIMAVKFLDASGSGYTSNAVSGLDYAVAHGALVSNNSWGGGGYDATLAAAIGRARTAGHIFVAAAGNSAQNIDVTASYPASYIQSYDNVVTVAATDSADKLASFSNYGATSVTLAAPGVSILSTTPNNTYSSFSGTSMATPHVTGAIALYWGANPTLKYTDVIAKLKSSVDPISGLTGKVSTGGRLNVAAMFAGGGSSAAPGPKITAATYSGTVNTQLDHLRLTFDRAVDAATFTSTDIVSFTGPNGAVTTGYTITPVTGSSTQFDVAFTAQTTAGSYSMILGPDIRDTSGNQMNQNGNTLAGETPGDRYTATGSLVLTVNRTYSTGTISLAILDLKTTTSTITVTEDVKITDLNVLVNLTHTYDSDLSITLTSPAGKVVTLFNRRGGSGDNLTNTVFDDEASKSIASGAAPFTGSFRPETVLTAFDGASTKGTWTLKVTDNASLDTGKLTGWSLVLIGTIGGGNGGASVQALGFRDEPLTASSDAMPEPLMEPLAVTAVVAAEPARAASPEPMAVHYGSASGGLLAWLDSPSERRDSYAPPAPIVSRDDRPAPVPGDDFQAPLAAAYAMLYLPPADPDTHGESFDAE